MPEDETISSFADRLIDLAEKVIIEQGGQRIRKNGQLLYLIQSEPPRNVEPLLERDELAGRMRSQLEREISDGLAAGEDRAKARAAYLAICLGQADTFRRQSPDQWRAALLALRQFDQITQVLFHHSPVPAAAPLQEKAIQAGLERPARSRRLW
jgi:hypothetical protein